MANNIAEMYQEMPGTEIKKQTGLTYHSIYRDLRAAGVEVRPRGRRPVLENPGAEKLDALAAEGLSRTDIARRYGVSKRTVQRWWGK